MSNHSHEKLDKAIVGMSKLQGNAQRTGIYVIKNYTNGLKACR